MLFKLASSRKENKELLGGGNHRQVNSPEVETLKHLVSLIGRILERRPAHSFVTLQYALLQYKDRLEYLTKKEEDTSKWIAHQDFSELSDEASEISKFSDINEAELESAEEMAEQLQLPALSRESMVSIRHEELIKEKHFYATVVPKCGNTDWQIYGVWRKFVGNNGYLKLKYLPTVHKSLDLLEFPSKIMTVLEFPDDNLREIETLKSFCNNVTPHENVSHFLFLERTPKEMERGVERLGHVFFYFQHQGEDLISYVNEHAHVTHFMFQNMISQVIAGFIHLHTCKQCECFFCFSANDSIQIKFISQTMVS